MARQYTPEYYISNAKEMLSSKAEKKGDRYGNIKYVQTASGTAYLGVLKAIDGYLMKKEGTNFKDKPKSIEEYRIRLGKHSKKLVTMLNDAYHLLHIIGYYYGDDSVKRIREGLEVAEKIIEVTAD